MESCIITVVVEGGLSTSTAGGWGGMVSQSPWQEHGYRNAEWMGMLEDIRGLGSAQDAASLAETQKNYFYLCKVA
jgi:hypothetical protein